MLVGHVGGKPEVASLGEDRQVFNFSLATNQQYKDSTSGETKTITDWHRIAVFTSKNNSFMERFVDKGCVLY